MSTDSLLLAHLSDVHLAPMPGMALSAFNVKRALGAANWYRNRRGVHVRGVLDAIVADLKAQRPDHIAVTGDLVNLGLPREHEAALVWLEALGAAADVSVVPGNHDAYVRMRKDAGYRRWMSYMRGDEAGVLGAADANASFPYVRRRGPVALIGLGSGVPTRPFVSAGHLGAAQLAALRLCLEAARDAGLVRVVAIHHPPHRYRQEWRTGLRDAAALEDVLRTAGADLVLHGHFHRAQARWIEGTAGRVPIIGVPSASAAIEHKGDLAGYGLIAISRAPSGAARIELIRRGLREPGGPIVERARVLLT